jgi:hypothetical protein
MSLVISKPRGGIIWGMGDQPTFAALLDGSSFIGAGELLPERGEVTDVAAVCFVGGRVMLVRPDAKSPWDLLLGAAFPHEDPREATERVILERASMQTRTWKLLGYLVVPTEDGDALVAVSVADVESDHIHVPDTEGPNATVKIVLPGDVREYLPWTASVSTLMHRALSEKRSVE